MDISKYITNKDIQLSNDDINIEKLEKDIRKGYVSSDEVDKARKDALKESTATYTELYSSTSGLSPRGHLERPAEFHASTQDEA